MVQEFYDNLWITYKDVVEVNEKPPKFCKLRDGCEIIIERVSSNDKRQIFQQFLNEILVSNILHHKNLVTFRGYAFHHEEFLVAHEYLSNGTLAAYLECEIQHNKCTLPLLTRMEIAIDIANALSYLHKHGIIHPNINSSYILLDKNMCAKVAGLYLSRKLPEDVSVNATSVVSISSDIAKTCVYIDPEYVCLNAESAPRMMFIASE
ncbi:LEAF RUST 10 DISEASE-RESISTANCE LOCUS RECEPTOR-LIKE PROTEIN KINASE-like 1.1 [Arachis stenosperma]|uniref:LEAF RUST 10 DISEASE-RESISTANCE LOCUS RECEPTOR-LIKE PROTEIN KINASE-like 1.1 n=1 Tax=Arachis stenosperma TaxID=217475 RepID=UPI0025AD6055|nr:LEAF RUST 10 DISEASE-RESISTANCE LOCUS RECEPTOR-LIKE PROTEIN KINASE-like 1.1 [Arachis stenosperma]